MLENKSFNDTFCWGPDGTTFLVKDINDFSRTILPKHFKHCNFASFVRQLNKYDFHKVRNPEDGHRMYADQVWVHPKFRRDRKDLLEEIRRKSPGKPKKDKPVLTGDADVQPLATTSTDQEPSHQSSIDSLLELTRHLQAQVDGLRKSQTDMELQMQKMNRADQQIADELVQFNKSMAAKDNLLQQFVKIDTENNQAQSTQRQTQSQNHHTSTIINMSSVENNNQQIYDTSTTSTPTPTTNYQDNTISPKLDQSKKRKDCGGACETNEDIWLQQQQQQQQQQQGQNSIPSSETTAQFREIQAIPFVHLAKQSFDGSCGMAHNPETMAIHLDQKMPERVALLTVGRLAATPNTATSNPKEIALNDCGEKGQRQIMDATTAATKVSMPVSMTNPRLMNSGSSATGKVALPGWAVSPRILLVDDDSVYRDISRKLLNTIGCTIDLAQDGLEALRKMGLEKYDLILMDIVMPNLDGISATRNIRQYDALTPIISMTSNFSDSDIMQYIGSGMTDILPKPFSKSTLYNILEKYCAHLRAIQRVQGSVDPSIVHRSLGNLGLLPPSGATIETAELPIYSNKADTTFSMTSFPLSSSSSSSSLTPFPAAMMATSLPAHFINPYSSSSSSSSPSTSSTLSSSSSNVGIISAVATSIAGSSVSTTSASSTSAPAAVSGSRAGGSNVTTDMFWSVAQPYQNISSTSTGARTLVVAPENDGKIVWIMPPQIIDESYKDTESCKRRKMEES
ncbi:heat shock factor-type transcription factor [Phycomyces blakesleeanus]